MYKNYKSTIYNKKLYEIAQKHNEEMINDYSDDTIKSVKSSIIYRSVNEYEGGKNDLMVVELADCTTSDAIFEHANEKVCALNFASFNSPGGGFIKGSMAQEEALCHESNLYNILSDERFKEEYAGNWDRYHGGLYEDFAIYSPDVVFIKDDTEVLCDILTVAAPNWSGCQNNNVTYVENCRVLGQRMDFLLTIAANQHVDTLILGAWGCGVFKQDPEIVANMFLERIKKYNFNHVVFAVPAGKNYDEFSKVIKPLDVIGFFKPNQIYGEFSQWYKNLDGSIQFSDSDGDYLCCEQYMMAKKAKLFGDDETFSLIMSEKDPAKLKELGRLIRGFNQEVWDSNKYEIVLNANLLKFGKNETLKNLLLKTGNAILCEASPYDKIWGIGMDLNNPDHKNKKKWLGKNLLGKALMEVRCFYRK